MKDDVTLQPRRPTWPELIPVNCSMTQPRVLLLPLDRMLVHRSGYYPQQYVAHTHFIHLDGERLASDLNKV